MTAIRLHCPACGREYDPSQGLFACPGAHAPGTHLLDPRPRPAPEDLERILGRWRSGERDAFVLFQELLTARALLEQARYDDLLGGVNRELRRLEGRCFEVTPLAQAPGLASALGRAGTLWAKDETGNVTGSHKGRHLMATLLYLEALRLRAGESRKRPLAIYSCGNAALAAAALARAGGYELRCFVPPDVEPSVERALLERGARVAKVGRDTVGQGDPCHLAFLKAVREEGCAPFSCSGTDNWSNIEGGRTLGFELALQLADAGARPDHLALQVGGGALARSVAGAWELLHSLDASPALPPLPRFHAAQAMGAFPFVRAWALLLDQLAGLLGLGLGLAYDRSAEPKAQLARLARSLDERRAAVAEAAEQVKNHFETEMVQSSLRQAAQGGEPLMWAWDGAEPASAAHGILDDVTYDWYWLALSLLRTGGLAVAVPEASVVRMTEAARASVPAGVSATGASGLAGLARLQEVGAVPASADAVVLLTGAAR